MRTSTHILMSMILLNLFFCVGINAEKNNSLTKLNVQKSDHLSQSTTNSSIQIITPNFYKKCYSGTLQNIVWKSEGIDNVLIEYSVDNGSTWNLISDSTDSDGTFLWEIPEVVSNQCLIKISDVNNLSDYDICDNSFSILEQPDSSGYWELLWSGDHSYIVNSIVFSPTGDQLATANYSTGYELKIWDPNSGEIIWQKPTNSILAIHYLLDGSGIITNETESIKLLNSDNGEIIWTAEDSYGGGKIVVNPDGTSFASNGNNEVRVWDIATGELIWRYPLTGGSIDIEYNLDGTMLISKFGSNTYSFNSADGEVLWTKSGIFESNFEFCPDGIHFVSGYNLVKLGDSRDGSVVWSVRSDYLVETLSISNDGTMIITGERNGKIILLDLQSGAAIWRRTLTGALQSTKFNLTDDLIVTCSWSDTIKLWEVDDGSLLWQGNHIGIVDRVIFSPDGTKIVSAGRDNLVKVWTNQESISLLAPNGGENWVIGNTEQITWHAVNTDKVGVEFSSDNGVSWEQINSNIYAYLGSYDWTIPNAFSSECRIKISNSDNESLFDTSENVFSIIQPDLIVNNPISDKILYTNYEAQTYDLSNVFIGNVGTLIFSAESSNSVVVEATVSGYILTLTPHLTGDSEITITADDVNGNHLSTVFNVSVRAKSIALISPNGGGEWLAGSTKQIKWDCEGLNSVKIEFSNDNRISWETIELNWPAIIETYSWEVPNTPSTECRIRIRDASDTSILDISDDNFTIIEYPTVYELSHTTDFNGVSQNNFRMIGIPGQSNLSVSTLFNGTQGEEWNVYWDNGSSSVNVSDYQIEFDGSNEFIFRPGKGFWALSNNQVAISETVNSVELSDDIYYSIPLHDGWNIIANPFNKNILWSEVVNANPDITQPIYDFNGTYNQASQLDPFKGYYFNNITNSDELKIPYVPSSAQNMNIEDHAIQSEKLRITLLCNLKETSSVEIDFDNNALCGADVFDIYSPGVLFSEKDINIISSDANSRNKYLKVDKRPANYEGYVYNLELINNKMEPLILNVDGIEKFNGHEIYLIDEGLNKSHDLSVSNSVGLNSERRLVNLKLLIGTKNFVSEIVNSTKPTDYHLYQNFPNPFNPSTTIRYSISQDSYVGLKIYNTLGEYVTTLIDDEFQATGFYEKEFSGVGLPSGLYIAQLVANGFKKYIKMVLLK